MRNFTSWIFAFALSVGVFLTASAQQATNIGVTSPSTGGFTIGWSNGTGSKRIVVINTSPIAFTPVNNNTYAPNTDFTMGTDLGGGQKCVYNNNSNSVPVTGLATNTKYYIQIWEYSGAPGAETYVVVAGAGNPGIGYSLASKPTANQSVVSFSSITPSSMVVNLATPGNGSSRLLVAYAGTITFTPADGFSYPAVSDYSVAINQGVGKIVGVGAGPFTITGLTPNTTFNYKVFEFNGTAGTGAESYYTGGTPSTGSQITAPTAPSQASISGFSALGTNGFTVGLNAGGGSNRIVVMNTSPITFTPAQGITYSVNNDFTTGTDLGSGQKCVFNGSGTSAPIVGLNPNTQYYFQVFEYSGGAGLQSYSTGGGNTANRYSLANPPTTDEVGLTFTSVTQTSMTVNISAAGNGAARMLVANNGGVGFAPVDGTSYTDNGGNYGTATNQSGGGRIVGIGAGPFVITNMTAGTSYQFKVYEFNGTVGTGAENYFTGGTPGSGTQSTAPAAPTTQGSVSGYSALGTNGYTIGITTGNGSNRIVIINTSAITFTPAQGVTYTPNNDFSTGTDLGAGQKCIYNSNGNSAPVVGLLPNTQYFVTVYEYNGGAGLQSYNTTVNTSNRFSLASEPTTDEVGMTFSSITPTGMTVTMTTPGNGATRMLVANNGGVGFSPVDGTSYTANGGNYGTATNQSGGGRIVGIGAGPFVITNMSANTSYQFKVYEFNGTLGTGSENYFTGGTPGSGTQSTAPNPPSNQASISSFTAVGINGFTVNWGGGNGTNRIVIVDDAPISFTPAQGIAYPANSTYGAGTDLGSGQQCVYNSNGATVAITGLNALTTYYVQIFEYNGGAGLQSYDLATNANNPKSQITLCQPPLTQATALTFGTTIAGSMDLSWTPGSGAGSLVIARKSSAIGGAGVPASGTAYPDGGNVYAAGFDFPESGNDDYVVYSGTGSSFTLTGLSASTTYFFAVYSYNTTGTCYLIGSPATGNHGTPAGAATSTFSTGSGGVTINSTIVTEPAEVVAFTFTAKDLGDDGASTAFSQLIFRPGSGNEVTSWSDVIGGAELYDNIGNGPSSHGTAIIGTNTITIPSISTANSPDLGVIVDTHSNGTSVSRIYTLKIWLKNPVTGGFASSIDKQHIVLSITGADALPVATFGSFNPTTTTASGVGTNQIAVLATKITVLQAPGLTAFQGAALSPEPMFEGVDIYGNRDLDFAEAITVNTAPNLGPAGAPANFVAGVADFTLTTFNFTIIGNSPMKVTTPSITAANSTPTGTIVVSGNNESTIVENTSTFTYPSLIDYTQYQRVGSLVGQTTGVLKVGEFLIQDGGADLTDADGVPTTLTNITLTVTNPGNIRSIGIHDGSSIVASVAGGPTATFSGLSIAAADGILLNPKAFGIYVSFNAPVTDNQHFEFQITSVTASASGSVFAHTDGTAGGTGGAKTSTVLTDNSVVVNATKLNIIQQPTNTLIDVAMAPSISVETVDALGSRDVDYPGSVTITSTGVPAAQGSITLAAGTGTIITPITHSDKANNLQLTASLGGVTSAVSNTFNITTSAQADIVLDGSFTEPTDILYAKYQTGDIQGDGVNDIAIARFIIRDKGALPTELDGAPTRIKDISFTVTNVLPLQRLALYDNLGVEIAEVAAAATTTFTGINYGPADDGTKTFTVFASFNSTPATVVDNTQFQLTISAASTTTKSSDFASANAGGAATTIAGNSNKIEVVATQLIFTTEPAATQLPNKGISLQPPVPVIQAYDAHNILDADYASTTIAVSNAGLVPMANAPGASSLSSGLLTFANNFQYTDVGDGTLTVATSTLNQSGGTVASAVSTAVAVAAGTATTISNGTAPATISSITNVSPGTGVFHFVIFDDQGAPPANNDGSPTLIKSITITQLGTNSPILGTWTDAILGAQLDDGAGHITNGVNVVLGATSIKFNSMLSAIPVTTDVGYIQDDMSKTYTLSIWLKPGMTLPLPTTVDGASFGFEVKQINIATSASGTGIIGGAHTDSGGATFDQVAVVATEVDYTTLPATASLFTGTIVVAEARDQNGNRDLGDNGTITLSNTAGFAMANQPAGPFVSGVLSFPVDNPVTTGVDEGFQFTSTLTPFTTKLTLNVAASGGAGPITGTSATINVLSSFDSWLYVDPSFAYTAQLPYVGMTSGAALANDANSTYLARMVLSDGGSATSTAVPITNPSPGTKNTAFGTHNDTDGAFTKISDFTVSVTHYADIQKMAVFDALNNKISTDQTPTLLSGTTGTVTFSGLAVASLTAADNDVAKFYIRASFNVPAADQDQITIQVTNVTWNAGSQFTGTAGYIGGVNGGDITDGTKNKVNVLATKLDFLTQPGAFAGINQPITIPSVAARDINNKVDTDQDAASLVAPTNISIATPANGGGVSSGSLPFAAGLVNFTGFEYTSVGTTASAPSGNGTLNVSTKNAVGATITGVSNRVDVLNVNATAVTGGVPPTTSLAGGSVNKVIFGVTFTAPYSLPGSPGKPLLNNFIISFSNPFVAIFKNIRIFENTSATSFGGNNIVTTGSISATLTPGVHATSGISILTVNFPTPRDLSTGPLSYYVEVDVDPSASGSTPSIQPYVFDGGFTDPVTDNDIGTSQGSAFGNTNSPIAGQTYTFASIIPPSLVTSNPSSGQTNVDPNTPSIDLTFSVPVWTLDSQIILNDGVTNLPIGPLSAINGQYLAGTGTLKQPISFAIPPGTMVANHLYYITIPAGDFISTVAPNNVGIMDQSNNLFPGINYNGTLYFKTANPNPPLMVTTTTPTPYTAASDPVINNISLSGAVINATFDQKGKAYYLVLSNGSAAPTVSQIKGLTAYVGSKAQGSFNIAQVAPLAQFGVISTASPLSTNTSYDVWLAAENDALPTPVGTPSYYEGSPNYAIHNILSPPAGPTFTFTTPASAPPGFTVNSPSINICTNSYQYLNSPIIISESSAKNEFSGGAGVDQTFNLVLPAGFVFDVSLDALSNPVYGTITLSSNSPNDFTAGSGKLSFVGNTVLTATFRNNGSSSLDNIIISGLRVLATSSTGGAIKRLGGTAFTTNIVDGQTVANVSANDAPVITFYNSYSQSVFGTKLVTTIPDVYTDNTVNPPLQDQVQLFPVTISGNPLASIGDFGPSTFSGVGVNGNLLSLKAPTLGTPFNITVTHTDNNGCVSQNPVQYTVYNHNTAISQLQPNYCATNIADPSPAPTTPPASADVNHKISYDRLSAYYLLSLTTAIPQNATAIGTLDAQGNPATTNQLIFGPQWSTVVSALAVQGTSHDPGSSNPVPGQLYYDYTFDDATILNAKPQTLIDPYDYFKSAITAQNHYYWSGGSLGKIEFTGRYQSIANSAVTITLKQNTEYFVPAIPLVEVGQANQSNALSATVPIFCQAGGPVIINGYPAAAPGSSVGRFTLMDGATVIYDFPPSPGVPVLLPGFTDNQNGTASLDPSVITNGYRPITILYSYQSNGSPCSSQAKLTIMVSPNPVATFTTGTLCQAGTGVPFTDQSTIASAPGVSITKYAWDFADANSAANTSNTQNPNHIYADAGTYNNVSLQVTSSDNCASPVATQTLVIGSTPVVDFTITGVIQTIKFTSLSSVAVPLPPNITSDVWDFGDGSPTSTTGLHTYSPGVWTVTLTTTSTKGCVNSAQKPVVTVLPVVTSASSTYLQTFQTDNGSWQAYTPSTVVPSSWQWGHPTKTLPSVDSLSAPNSNNLWVTNLSGPYNVDEQSALYSPAFDISALTRPMISFNANVDLQGSDGVVLQYSTDNYNIADQVNKVWLTLGSIGSGVDWYSSSGLSSNPGNQGLNPVGWATNGGSTANWLESKHQLDALGGPSQVVFRFALANNTSTPLNGFAIDNFRLGNRTRTLMLENFKNLGNVTGASDELAQSIFLNGFNTSAIGTQLVKLNYDVAFPGIDPLNLDNAADPSARALYYNINQTPVARLDGSKNPGSGEDLFENWGPAYYNLRSLQLAEADIFIENVTKNDATSTISFDVRVVPIVSMQPNTTVQVAIAQQVIASSDLSSKQQGMIKTGETSFEFVMKKMLPSAAGTLFGQAYNATTLPPVYHFDYTIDPTIYYGASIKNISIVAFLQDADTKEVWQSEILSDLDQPGSTITGLTINGELVKIFPNPSNQQFTIQLPEPAKQQVSIRMLDQMGKIVHESTMSQGDISKTVMTTEFAQGVYILQIDGGTDSPVRSKIVVTH